MFTKMTDNKRGHYHIMGCAPVEAIFGTNTGPFNVFVAINEGLKGDGESILRGGRGRSRANGTGAT